MCGLPGAEASTVLFFQLRLGAHFLEFYFGFSGAMTCTITFMPVFHWRLSESMRDDAISLWREALSEVILSGQKVMGCTEDDLSSFEVESSIKLPKGYGGFCQVFGTGEFSRFVRIYCPCALKAENDIRFSGPFTLESLKEAVKFERESHDMGHPSAKVETITSLERLLDSAIVFGDTVRADIFLWDLKSYKSTDQSYDIYMVPLDDLDQSLLVGRDFSEFVRSFCLSSKSDEILPPELRFDESRPTNPTFVLL